MCSNFTNGRVEFEDCCLLKSSFISKPGSLGDPNFWRYPRPRQYRCNISGWQSWHRVPEDIVTRCRPYHWIGLVSGTQCQLYHRIKCCVRTKLQAKNGRFLCFTSLTCWNLIYMSYLTDMLRRYWNVDT